MGGFAAKFRGFLGWVMARLGGSAHGGHGWHDWAKKFLKIFKKGVKNPKIGVREGSEGGAGAPYIGRAR